MSKRENKSNVIILDRKEHINIEELNRILRGYGFTGSIREVDTGDDTFGIVVANHNVSSEKAQKIFDREVAEYGM